MTSKTTRAENALISNLIVFGKYARYNKKLERRENWDEIVERDKKMKKGKFPHLSSQIDYFYQYVKEKKVLPAMRALQFAGAAIQKNNARQFNCAYAPVDHHKFFGEFAFLLLSGVGVGYSVEEENILQLPKTAKSAKIIHYTIQDTIEGWADAFSFLLGWAFGLNDKPQFDYSQIRKKGSPLRTSGGKAPGYEPLKSALDHIDALLSSVSNRRNLTSLEIHSICCRIADCSVSGGIRRSATICFFDLHDKAMLACKTGKWWENNPHFARANNSAVAFRDSTTQEEITQYFEFVRNSGSGEPGIYWVSSRANKMRSNPCGEIGLRPFSFCNLAEINGSSVENQDDFLDRCEAAAFIATLQASYTDFHYLRPIWKTTTDGDALIGVGITGIGANKTTHLNLADGADVIKITNETWAKEIGIQTAARTTTVKPSGTASIVLSWDEVCSSGIHAYHNGFYIRRTRLSLTEAMAQYLLTKAPGIVKASIEKPDLELIVEIPQKAPDGDIALRTESALTLLDRVGRFNKQWIQEGHRRGDNFNNVSCTVSVKEEEWEDVEKWIWENRFAYHGISVFPYSDHSYVQAVYEDCSEEEYLTRLAYIEQLDLDFNQVKEDDDKTNLAGEAACAGGFCEIV